MSPSTEWFRTTVICEQLPPYPAEVEGARDAKGFVRPRFSADVVARIAADLQQLPDPHFVLRTGDGFIDVLDPRGPSEIFERVGADSDGKFALGHGYWPWREFTDHDTRGLAVALRQMARTPYTAAGPNEWTVAVADHGDWAAILATYQTPAEAEAGLREELYFRLWSAYLASFQVTAADPAAAELAVRRWFAANRADVDPAAACQPLALPDTRIPGPSGP